MRRLGGFKRDRLDLFGDMIFTDDDGIPASGIHSGFQVKKNCLHGEDWGNAKENFELRFLVTLLKESAVEVADCLVFNSSRAHKCPGIFLLAQ